MGNPLEDRRLLGPRVARHRHERNGERREHVRDCLRSFPAQMDVKYGGIAPALLDEREGLGNGRGGSCDLKTGRFESPAKLKGHKRVVLDH